jgi:hypothetical protein
MISDDGARAVGLARETLAGATERDWQVPAGTLEWTCRETVEHVNDALFSYDVAAGLGLAWTPPGDLCASTLRRLFPAATAGGGPWETFLEVTGRGKTEVDRWRWDGTPR